MDDFKKDDVDKIPQPPSTRSEKIGPGGTVRKGSKKGLSQFFTKKWLLLVTFTSLLLLVGGCSAIILSAKTYPLQDINKVDFSTVIYSKDRKTLVGKVGNVNQEYLTYEQIIELNPDLPMAFVKVEDERFFEHHGVDYRGIGRAFVANITAKGYQQGASTITMQVVRDLLKDRRKSLLRKLKEIVGAYNLEREASKKKILEAYMNRIEFGNGVHGVELASKVYFGVSLKTHSLRPEQIALLAGLPKAPYGYNPYGSKEQQARAVERRNVVLKLMTNTTPIRALITEGEKLRLQKLPLGVNEKYKEQFLQRNENDAYKDFVQKELRERYGITYADLTNGNYKVYTAMDSGAQKSVDKTMKDDRLFYNKEGVNAGITMMNSRTGEVIAIGGGRTFTPGSYNWAMMKKQPGSSIKPLTVYAPLVEFKDYNEYTLVKDEPFNYHGWKPQNYVKGKFYGEVPLKFVVTNSLNVSTAKLLIDEVTVPRAYDFVTRELELPLLPQDEVPAALALGGLTEGVSTVNMAQAFSAFSNRGEMTKAHAVLEVIDSEKEVVRPLAGKEVDAYGNPKRVITEKTAWYMTRMLREVVTSGTGRGARLAGGRPVAGKSGTTQYSREGSFVGYTPSIVCAVEVHNNPGAKETVAGGSLPARIFSRVMSETLHSKPVQYFSKPIGIEEPAPPFQLKEPEVKGKFHSNSGNVHLSWAKQVDRVTFEVLRSEDKRTWMSLAELPAGSTEYTDSNVLLNQLTPLPDGAKKAYYYQVVAIDDVVGERKSSNPVKVVIKMDSSNQTPGIPGGGGSDIDPQLPVITPTPSNGDHKKRPGIH